MTTAKSKKSPATVPSQLQTNLTLLGLPFMAEHHPDLANRAVRDGLGHLDYLAKLTEGELNLRRDRATLRRVKNARFPVIKTLDQFSWNWPKSINRMAVQNLFRLQFHKDNANIIFLGAVGLGKTHLATALGYAACLAGKSVLFSTAVDAINTLAAAQATNRLKAELKKYLSPSLLILDELGYLPIDKLGADLLFQIISQRYERGSIIVTSNRAFKQWPEIFNNDSMLTSAILDRLLHHAETMVIEGKSYRMKDQTDY
ncbi:MAG: ATP-binding protein [Deltaproteobacteria bacterium CG23_combo_of_CG06-09_8_20_14_all_51_20]|nr:ATP-binding protein [Deltaproteobacteria bacterium]PIP47244.1 MAG: ATP-binding protein [Deltaproteobacteria bacterium CG23_combo_of_CG06-09_8_20_14_all_51_20]PIY43514.1 MAG: ATP-binding protein [Armatimonadetes bacterium CG_4_10_14_3_um_filter_59_10]